MKPQPFPLKCTFYLQEYFSSISSVDHHHQQTVPTISVSRTTTQTPRTRQTGDTCATVNPRRGRAGRSVHTYLLLSTSSATSTDEMARPKDSRGRLRRPLVLNPARSRDKLARRRRRRSVHGNGGVLPRRHTCSAPAARAGPKGLAAAGGSCGESETPGAVCGPGPRAASDTAAGRALGQAAVGLAAAAVVSLTGFSGDVSPLPTPPARAESLTVAFPVSKAREVSCS